MTARYATWLWVAQRASAAVLALFVVVHLATMTYAVQGGLSAEEILSRTRGHFGWLLFYAAFVAAVAVHVPVGLRNIVAEHGSWRGPSLEIATWLVGVLLALFGFQAVWAVFV